MTAEAITGRLFPSRYIRDQLLRDAPSLDLSHCRVRAARLRSWWNQVASTCGPATGLRALADVVAMPLFGALGFRATELAFEPSVARVCLETRNGTAVALVVLPWASRPSGLWRLAMAVSRQMETRWCFILAPPFLTLVPVDTSGLRRSVDFTFPDAFGDGCAAHFLALARAESFDAQTRDAAPIDALVASSERFQDRVRSDLQDGVVASLASLMPVIAAGRSQRADDRFEQTLTVLYRVLFLLFAESRDLVPRRHPIYRDAYALGTLCRQARSPDAARGLWDALAAVTKLSRNGCRVDDLIVRPFNGRLFARSSAPALEHSRTARRPTPRSRAQDAAMQRVLVALASRETRYGREDICFADLGVEQLGAVYERVLDLDPRQIAPDRTARRAHSLRRKQTGTFYTPQELTELVVDRTLAPLVRGRSADAILELRVVDPAMGSGAFLVAACRYLSAAYARAVVDEGRYADTDIGPRERAGFRRLIAERCLAGVDANPIAVQLARLSLWLTTLAEGKPLSFLDHRLRAGNSLVGAAPGDLARIPCARARPTSSLPLFDDLELAHSMRRAASSLLAMARQADDTIEDVRTKEAAWSQLTSLKSPLALWRRALNLWCSRWFWSETAAAPPSPSELRAAIDALIKQDRTLPASHLVRLLRTADDLHSRQNFFHWPIEYADVFYDDHGCPKDVAGFDAVIGNPPWEMLRNDGASERSGAGDLLRFIRDSGLYPSCDRGHMNLYQPFLERSLSIVRRGGRVGLVMPWGLAVDDGATRLRKRLLDRTAIDTLVGVDNAHGIFPIHRGVRFLVMVTTEGGRTDTIRATFGIRSRQELTELDAGDPADGRERRTMCLSRVDIAQLGGASDRIPDLRRAGDVELLDALTARCPRLGSPGGWNARFGRELNATEDRSRFGPMGLPVLEGKHVQPFVADVRACTSRIPEAAAIDCLKDARFSRTRLAYRDVAAVSNRVSLIAAVIPPNVVTTHTLFCLRTELPPAQQHFLCAIFNSYVVNAVARMLMGGHLTTSLIEALPVPVWTGSVEQKRIARLAARLSRGGAHPVTAALLQASVAQLYALTPAVFEHVLDAFPLVPAGDRERALRSLLLRYSPRRRS